MFVYTPTFSYLCGTKTSIMNIGKKIISIRKAKNLSQKEIALSVRVDRALYSKIENNKANPTLTTLEKIAKALKVNMGEFFTGDNGYDVNSYDKSLVERMQLLEQLSDEQKKLIFSFIDTILVNKKLKDKLTDILQEVAV